MAPKWTGLHRLSVAYAATSFGYSLMHAVFMFYYVKVYLNEFHVSQSWFQLSQVVFMVWNAFNDPLFGYIQDNYNWSWVNSRRHTILYGAPLFAASFLVPWFPWGDYSRPTWLAGVQLMVSLCFYDALFTFVLLAQCALFTEISTKQADRIQLIRYSKVANIIGSSSVFFCNLISKNLTEYSMFMWVTVVIALLSLACMTYSGLNVSTEYERKAMREKAVIDPSVNPRCSEYSYLQQTFQIFSQKNFVSFVTANLIQSFHHTWLINFTAIICDNLIPDTVLPTTPRSVLYGSFIILPQLTVILGAPLVSKIGYYKIIKFSYYIKIFLGLGLLMLGPIPHVLAVFFLLESINVGASAGLFELCLSDIIDADREKYQRSHPISSMIYGNNALVTKPAQSLAPMAAVAILNNFGYQQLQTLSSDDERSITDGANINDLHSAMFYMCCILPVLVGIIQNVIWKFYTLRTTHLTIVQNVEL